MPPTSTPGSRRPPRRCGCRCRSRCCGRCSSAGSSGARAPRCGSRTRSELRSTPSVEACRGPAPALERSCAAAPSASLGLRPGPFLRWYRHPRSLELPLAPRAPRAPRWHAWSGSCPRRSRSSRRQGPPNPGPRDRWCHRIRPPPVPASRARGRRSSGRGPRSVADGTQLQAAGRWCRTPSPRPEDPTTSRPGGHGRPPRRRDGPPAACGTGAGHRGCCADSCGRASRRLRKSRAHPRRGTRDSAGGSWLRDPGSGARRAGGIGCQVGSGRLAPAHRAATAVGLG